MVPHDYKPDRELSSIVLGFLAEASRIREYALTSNEHHTTKEATLMGMMERVWRTYRGKLGRPEEALFAGLVELYGLKRMDPKLDHLISELGVSVRVSNCFESVNMLNIGELVECSEEHLLRIRRFGKTALIEVQDRLGANGLSLDMAICYKAPDNKWH